MTEATAGSGLVGPTLFDTYRRFTPEPALLYACPSSGGRDQAWPRSSPAGASPPGPRPGPAARPWLPSGLRLTGTEGAGEGQTPVHRAAADTLAPGNRS